MPCSIPGMCSRDPNCADTHCPGRQIALDASDLAAGQRALHTEDGGTWFTEGHRVLRLRHEERQPEDADNELNVADRVLIATLLGVALFAAWSPLYF
jgi:hypothetical protein